MTNQLLANLQLVLPGGIGLFSRLDAKVSIAWLRRFTTQAQVDWLSPKRMDAWLSAVSYSGGKTGQQLHDHIAAAPRGLEGDEADAGAAVTLSLLDAIEQLNVQIAVFESQIGEQLDPHPDTHVFTSLPKAGTHPRCDTRGRDRRRTRTVPHRRLARRARRMRPIHPSIRQAPRRDVPVHS